MTNLLEVSIVKMKVECHDVMLVMLVVYQLVAELGSSMESLRQQQLVVDRRTDAMKTELVNLLSNNTNDIASCKV
jgi:hypothetical protein